MRAMTMVLMLGAAACSPATQNAAIPPAPQAPERANVVEVLATPALVGETVHVTGRCVAYAVPSVNEKSPAVSDRAWLLEDYGQAVWVDGERPATCANAEPSTEIVSVVGIVRQDTVPMLGGSRGMVRRWVAAR